MYTTEASRAPMWARASWVQLLWGLTGRSSERTTTRTIWASIEVGRPYLRSSKPTATLMGSTASPNKECSTTAGVKSWDRSEAMMCRRPCITIILMKRKPPLLTMTGGGLTKIWSSWKIIKGTCRCQNSHRLEVLGARSRVSQCCLLVIMVKQLK